MSNIVVLNSSNVVASGNNSQFQYNFINGAFVVEEGSEICVSSIVVPYSWFNLSSTYYNNVSFQYTWRVGITTTTYSVTLPNGFYSVSDISTYLQGVFINAGQYLIDTNGNQITNYNIIIVLQYYNSTTIHNKTYKHTSITTTYNISKYTIYGVRLLPINKQYFILICFRMIVANL